MEAKLFCQQKRNFVTKVKILLLFLCYQEPKLEKKKLTKKEKRDHKRVMDVIHTKIDCSEQQDQQD